MKRALRWLRNGALALVVLLVLILGAAYFRSEQILRTAHRNPGKPVAVPDDSASVAEGARLAKVKGCAGCHSENLQGRMFIDDPLLARIAAPDLTASARDYSDAELERIIRHGIKPDNRSVMVMPSDMFYHLTDAETGKLLAYIRSLPPSEGQPRMAKAGPLGRIGIATGKFSPTTHYVRKAAAADDSFPGPDSPYARGVYLARTTCTECHGITLKGQQSPDLSIAAGYSREQFARLMKTGIGLGDRELPLMSGVARSRFAHFTDEEIDALYDYLKARAAGQQGP